MLAEIAFSTARLTGEYGCGRFDVASLGAHGGLISFSQAYYVK
jgi:hypothetical protein